MAADYPFLALRDQVSSALLDATRTTGQICNEDLAFHCSSNPSTVPALETQSSRLLQLGQKLIRSFLSDTGISAPHLSNSDSVEDNWKCIVEIFDDLLEKADACLDEYTGAIRRSSPFQEGQIKRVTSLPGKQKLDGALRLQTTVKPQSLFKQVPSNDRLSPFKPLLSSKPHAITPLQESLLLVTSSDDSQQYQNPYDPEIRSFQYPAKVFIKASPIPYMPFDSTTATLVDTPKLLMSMIEELRSAEEIAIDLEHHDEHSYIGLVSLMQISTREKDWIIDTLKPWRQDLEILNKIFADPKILKIFHGAFMDIIWLQRDFGLYVVGLFDTYHASRALGYPRKSLAYLLKRFADFDAAKQYQMADWRIRPLPEEMFQYARSDTHFLLFIYDNLRNELLEKTSHSSADGDLVRGVMAQSKEESLQRYERPIYDFQHGMGAMGWYNLLCRTPNLYNREQFAIFRAVHQWRDTIARKEDESIHTIMSKRALFNIAREMPTDMLSLLGCSHPISPFLHRHKKNLLRLVVQARADSAAGPEMRDLRGAIHSPRIDQRDSVTKDMKLDRPSTNVVQEPEFSTLARPILSTTKSETSVFWGSLVFRNLSLRDHHIQLCTEDLHLSLPLPQMVSETPGHRPTASGAATADLGTGPTVPSKQRSCHNRNSKHDFFVVKNTGLLHKRKIHELREGPEPLLTNLTGLDTEEIKDGAHEQARSAYVGSAIPQAKLLETERSKRAKKTARGSENSAQRLSDAQGFDYANAPSVLHAMRGSTQIHGQGRKAEEPYSKSMDAPKGLRRTRNEAGGSKSLTFKP